MSWAGKGWKPTRTGTHEMHLLTMSEDRMGKVIGKLSLGLLQKIDFCLKAALGFS